MSKEELENDRYHAAGDACGRRPLFRSFAFIVSPLHEEGRQRQGGEHIGEGCGPTAPLYSTSPITNC